MLLGTHSPKLDDKGRVILPAKFRDDLGAGVVITRGQDRCLYVFSTEEFERVHERIREAPLSNKQARDFLRMFLSGASAEKPDSQNRITVPPALRAYAGLGRELVVTGVGAHAEIWDAEAWNAYAESNEDTYAEMEQEVIPGLF
ncbi:MULTISPECIES: division/cell wall cluster transcriptional repressor MraZ [unclassified Microbacterium]|jgi:MraZ protein|uniref:division/cell wall cluster transcriptional repressor MraZ n=1 Tax=unclassified Microbacterium TaxID=2609290 RepID=UPI0006FB58FE|nr:MULTISPECIES: division/cell wall cluster transcriptional repressor MraZ [unclassified Microbacterium]AOX44841.1 cell division/cell wall cluster transcriptional repressor MraZ [Microbacterium sp. BH-3-3-3]KQR89473.1 division/cell wall cluster transcriptional repressor MraZ [Microbacterium sp. Leaf179]KQT74592.1 division/cell wall cluster transcriptional repressor MraZ [Microbacterium sp. Leaf436]MBD8207083.1 division/cell wall cluster transcriptional repressor MraZ [Microbacterium sp. CFBP 88